MKTTKRISINFALLIALMVFLSSDLVAQQRQRQGPPPMPDDSQIEQMVEEMSEELSLTENQSTRVEEIFKEHIVDVNASMGNGERLSREEMESKKVEFEEDVKKLLNEDQENQFDEFMRKQSKGNQRPRR